MAGCDVRIKKIVVSKNTAARIRITHIKTDLSYKYGRNTSCLANGLTRQKA